MRQHLVFSQKRRTPAVLPLVAFFILTAGLGMFPFQARAIGDPTIGGSVYLDSDPGLDGTVERIRWTLSDTVTACVFEEGDWSIDAAGTIGVSDITGLSCTGATNYFDILVTTTAGVTGGLVDPVITYTNQGTLDSIMTAAGALSTQLDVAATDAAAPVIFEAEYYDTDSPLDGKIDRFVLIFSETVTAASVLRANDLTLTNDGDFNGALFGGAAADLITGSVTQATVNLGTESIVVDTNSDNLLISTKNLFSLTDGTNTNNTLGIQSQITFIDRAAPVLKQLSYHDLSPAFRDGKVDAISLQYSEELSYDSFLSLNDLVFTDVGDFTGMSFGSDIIDQITSGDDISYIQLELGSPSSVLDTRDNSGIAISTQNAFLLTDGTNVNTETGPQAQLNIVDQAGPIIVSAEYQDISGDGRIDRFLLTFSEPLHSNSRISPNDLYFESGDDDSGGEVGDFLGMDFGTDTTDLITVINVTELTVNLETPASVIDTREDSGDLFVLGRNSYVLYDMSFIYSDYSQINPTMIDGADVVVAGTNPGDGGNLRPLDGTFTVTFSEEMDSDSLDEFTGDPPEIWVDPDPGGLMSDASNMDSAGRTVLYIYHDAFDLDEIVDATLYNGAVFARDGSSIPEDYTFSFTAKNRTGGSSGSVSSTGSSTTPTVAITDPTNGEDFPAESFFDVFFSVGGAGISQAELRYSTDGGVTTTLIASNLSTTSPYSWLVPSGLSGPVTLYLYGQDSGKSTLASDSVNVTVVAASTPTEEELNEEQEAADAAAGITRDSEGRRTAPGSGTYGASPFDGSSEEISTVQSGWFIRSFNFPTVYYVADDSTRRPFWDATTFMTWAPTGWDNVVWVTDATLATLPLGEVMLPKPGVVLVKISSDPKVYAVEYVRVDDRDLIGLRWITTETIASGMYGAAWADYIIDIEPTVMGHFAIGPDMTFAETVDTSIMRTRDELAAMVAGM